MNCGWVEIIVGGMFSGKTEELVRRLRRAKIAKQPVLAAKPSLDDRYGTDTIASHLKNRFPCKAVPSVDAIRELVTDDIRVIGIDEAQFFGEELVAFVEEQANVGRRVIVAGLDLDSEEQPFKPLPHLMAVAEYVSKMCAICVVCGNPASRSFYKGDKADQIEVGADKYEARCRSCYHAQE